MRTRFVCGRANFTTPDPAYPLCLSRGWCDDWGMASSSKVDWLAKGADSHNVRRRVPFTFLPEPVDSGARKKRRRSPYIYELGGRRTTATFPALSPGSARARGSDSPKTG